MESEILKVIKIWMEGEINNFIKVWISVFISLSYCYFVGKIVPKGKLKLIIILPIICLFLYLPLPLHSMHLGGMTAFFIAWLANFKLLMFAFDIGPLSDPSISLPSFLALCCFPIKIQQNPPPKTQNKHNPLTKTKIKQDPSPKLYQETQNRHNPSLKTSKGTSKSPLNYAIKCFLVAIFIRLYDYSEHINGNVMLFIFCFHIYFCLELMLAMVAALARAVLGLELEPQFNEPYLSTSLQDFWGRRWNMMVSRILRPTVYEPVLNVSTRIFGRQWAPLSAVFSTFVVSAVMHELIFYYLGRVMPTWKITWFFLLHGVCLVIEIAIKKAVNGAWHVPQMISGPLTVGFFFVTIFWLFLPELLRCKGDVRAFEEYAAVGAFLKDISAIVKSKSLNATMV